MNEYFKDDKGALSMMRRISWYIVIVGLSWGTIEIIASIVMSSLGKEFDIHETLILTTLSIGVTGKGLQKIIEHNKSKSESIMPEEP